MFNLRMFTKCFIVSFGGGSSPPPVAPAADPPKVDDPAVEEAKRKERELNRRRRGRMSTILTGPSGLSDDPQGKTLLGQ